MNPKLTGEGAAADDGDDCNFRLETVIFEHRHENKSGSACPKDHFSFLKFSDFQVFRFSSFQNIPGSQLLSDIQTFFTCLCSKLAIYR